MNLNLNGKKLFLIGFIIILLIAIPVTIYFLQQQQQTKSRAEKSTVLKFSPDSTQASPIMKQIGDSIPLDVMVDPGTNLVSYVKLQIQYDTDKLSVPATGAFVPNTVVFPTVLEGPVYTPGKIEVSLSVGPDPTKAIQTAAKAGTINFTALANTADGQPTLVTYGITTQVLSIGSSDQASENVLSTSTPATIVIGATISPTGGGPSNVPIPSGSPTPTLPISPSPTSSVPTATTEPNQPTVTLSPSSPTPTGTGSASVNQAPRCNSLVVDRSTTGVAPYALTFTVNGNDTDGTISKVNFNFGDGITSGDITTSGGIGTNSVNVSTSHEYPNSGTFVASAIITDNSGDASSTDTCQQTILVQAGSGGGGGGGGAEPTEVPGGPTATPSIIPTMAATGSFGTALGIGAVALFFVVAGGLMFFIL